MYVWYICYVYPGILIHPVGGVCSVFMIYYTCAGASMYCMYSEYMIIKMVVYGVFSDWYVIYLWIFKGSVQWMMCMMCDLPCRYFDGGTLVHWVYDVWYTCAVVLHDLVKKSYCDYCGQYCDSRLRLQYNKQMVSWVYLLGYQGKCTQITGNLMFILNSNIQT